MDMKRLLLCLAGMISGVILAAAPVQAAEVVWPKKLVVAISASGNPVAMVTQGIAATLEKHTPIERVIVQPMGGIMNFGPRAERGQVDMVLFSAPEIFNAMYGRGDYVKKAFPFFRTLTGAAYQPFVVYTTPDKGIKTIADLKGKIIYSRNPGNTMFDPIVNALLHSAGLDQKDLKANLTKTNNAMATAAVIEGRADAIIAPAMSNITLELRQAKGECLMITPTDEEVARLKDKLPLGYTIQDIPAGNVEYANTEALENSPVYRNAIFVTDRMAPELAEAILDTMITYKDEWSGIHAAGASFGTLSPSLPLLHEGARAWYEKHGMLTDEIKAEQEQYAKELGVTAGGK